ncbi:MAG: hypothetical protein JXB07_17975 [Anaerolineae bacterium]|nr:hypothetical protein [Anaerolineae bacterium]
MDVDQILKKHDIGRGKVDIGKVIDLLKRGEKIAAVKLVVDQSGAGLKRSKELCDDLQEEID